ncbi:MAG: hypothetical protein ACP5OU_01555 [Methanothrix sp.]
MDDRLAVYIGAHPDDIDVGMSGSLYKFDLGKHPIMWVVVTDGGADADEYDFDSVHFDPGSLEPWVKKDDLKHQLTWQSPDGKEITRSNYSEDLVRKRCGIEFDDGRWKPKMARHTSSFGDEFDWRTRVTNCVGRDVELRQLSYSDPCDPAIEILYPDGSLSLREEIFTQSIAERLAGEIYDLILSKGYSRDLLYINSHAPDSVCSNSGEHEDHRIVGNAIMKSINILLEIGIKGIYATWFTIYKPIEPGSGYSKNDVDLSKVRNQKAKLCRECWETEFVAHPALGYYFKTWGERKWKGRRYPNNPLDFEYCAAMLITND